MGKPRYVSNAAYEKALDADFQTVMENAGFWETPREILTVNDMIKWSRKKEVSNG